MKKIITFLLAFLLIVSLAGCGGIKSKVYNESQKDTILKEVGESNLTQEERTLLAQAIIQEAFGGEKLDGKKIGDIISNQKKNVEEKARKEAEEKARKEAAAKELAGYIVATVENKKNIPRDIRAGRYGDTVTVDMQVVNSGKKDITAFKGSFSFYNLVGDKIITSDYYHDDIIKAGETKTIPLSYKINEFMSEHKKFYETELSKMNVKWTTTAIVFADGTKLGEIK